MPSYARLGISTCNPAQPTVRWRISPGSHRGSYKVINDNYYTRCLGGRCKYTSSEISFIPSLDLWVKIVASDGKVLSFHRRGTPGRYTAYWSTDTYGRHNYQFVSIQRAIDSQFRGNLWGQFRIRSDIGVCLTDTNSYTDCQEGRYGTMGTWRFYSVGSSQVMMEYQNKSGAIRCLESPIGGGQIRFAACNPQKREQRFKIVPIGLP